MTNPITRALAALCLFTCLIYGQSGSFLKNPHVRAERALDAGRNGVPASRSHHPGRRHRIVMFATPEAALEGRGELERRGLRVLRYLPDRGFVVSGAPSPADATTTAELAFDPSYKLSPQLDPAARYFLIEFHPDIDPAEARVIVAAEGLEIVENPDLAAEHVLIHAAHERAVALAAWDEVAYVFPASDELVHGVPVTPCSGAVTNLGAIGQYVARIGDGWAGPGHGAAALNYGFGALTDKLPADQVKAEIRRALAEWTKVAKLSFTETNSLNGLRTIAFLFARGEHGDGYAFDGPNKVLAHTFYPAPPNPEPLAGDMHFDADELWRIGADIDLYSVTLHELGHALGLGHSDQPSAVMYPYYRRATTLTEEDKSAVLSLYAPQDGQPAAVTPLTIAIDAPGSPVSTTAATFALSGRITGGQGDAVLSYTSDRGAAGSAQGGRIWFLASIPLASGSNNFTLTATDSTGARTTRAFAVRRDDPAPLPTPVTLRVISLTLTAIQGTASHPSGIQQVTWRTATGASGVASGTTQWSFTPVLATGANTITITVQAGDGTLGTVIVTITKSADSDRTPPSIAVVSPSNVTLTTRDDGITLSGTAADNVALSKVTWASSAGGAGNATGTTQWTTPRIPLLVGSNTITVRAYDAAGNSAWRSLVITRQR